MKKPKYISLEDALIKLQRYCVYQDRCHQEVRSKLLDLGIYGDDLGHIMTELIQDNFLNEERYACSFARGKHRIKKWGRVKIRIELKKRKISDYCMKKAMQEIDEDDYQAFLEDIITKKSRLLREKDPFKRKAKLAAFVAGKGYESALIWETIHRLFPK